MTTVFARLALTAEGWAENVRIRTDMGRIAALDRDCAPDGQDEEVGIVIPGLANAHSHAFQRVLAGHTEHRGPEGRDTFWTWRHRMYALAGRIDATLLASIARQVYCEMVATGYTSVAEFHYLHNEPGEPQPTDAMYRAIATAARDSGIRLTYVPVLYERAGFSSPEPTEEQKRFAQSVDQFVSHYRTVSEQLDGMANVGIGAHSLRAVSAISLQTIAEVAADHSVPMHIHIAEQQREVDECLATVEERPVAWLMDHCDVNERWCLVHATHIDPDETSRIVESGATVCLCPSTEANLGDGLFPLQAFLEQGGRIAIGSDSHVTVNPFEELRWLEYGQRLVTQQRNIAAIRRPETGRSLFELVATGGAAACGQEGGRIEPGANADLVVLDDDSPMLAGHTARSLLDALVFSGFTLPIDRVMVNGEWQVIDGVHRIDDEARREYRDAARTLTPEAIDP